MTTTTRRKHVKWTTELMGVYLKENYPWVHLIDGQEYTGNKAKFWFYCHTHGAYQASWNGVYCKSGTHQGSQCPGCKAAKTKARNDEITKAYVGVTTFDGHKVHELDRYHQSPSQKKKGSIGHAVYRYTCGACGNTEATALGLNLKIPGKTPGCDKCHSKRETIERHLRNKKKATEPCQLYVSDVYFGDYLKIGISKDYERRAASGNSGNPYYDKNLTPEEHYQAKNLDLSYEHCWYLSSEYPRAWVFAAEQVILKKTMVFAPTTPLPKEIIEVCWAGQTELRDWRMREHIVIKMFEAFIKEIQDSDGDWYKVYCKHINNPELSI